MATMGETWTDDEVAAWKNERAKVIESELHDPIGIELSGQWIIYAAQMGARRHAKDIAKGFAFHDHPRPHIWRDHVEGALAECAFCQYAGLPWSGLGHCTDEDAPGYEVRWVSDPSKRLIVREKDKDICMAVKMSGWEGNYLIHGFYPVRDAKAKNEWKDDRFQRKGVSPYFVPNSLLFPPDKIRVRI